MTPDEKQTWYVELIVCMVTGLLTLFVLLVHFTGFVYANQSTSNHLPEQMRMLGLGCPACHLVKQPPSECGHETQAWAWNECVLIEYLHRYPDEKGQVQQ